MNIELHIERLVLDGLELAPHQNSRLQAAIETELTRLLGEGGLSGQLAQGGAHPRVGANSIQPQRGQGPGQLGNQIAGAVYGSIGK